MTRDEAELVRARESNRLGDGCLLVFVVVLLIPILIVLLVLGGPATWPGLIAGGGRSARIGLGLGVVLPAALLALIVTMRAWKLLASGRARRSPNYYLIDEFHLREPEAFTCHDPVGHTVEGHHGSFQEHESEYLLTIGPDRVMYFSQHSRGDLIGMVQDGIPYGSFPTEFRLMTRAYNGEILGIEVVGSMIGACGAYRLSDRPKVLPSEVLGAFGRGWMLLEGEIGRPSGLRAAADYPVRT